MACIEYVVKNFRQDSLQLIEKINMVIADYKQQGFDLTLRQVYYQLVARTIIENNEHSYKNLGNLISDARLAGLIDWTAIEDRTRNVRGNSQWSSPASIIRASAYSYHLDYWLGQKYYVEVWVEKDALIGIVEQVCRELDVSHFSCRGYVSQSEMWVAAQRMIRRQQQGQRVALLHLGDHDPSGKDMSRDIEDRLCTFSMEPFEFKRLALNIEQIEQYAPPPNPTKVSDSRASGYTAEYGGSCWELDALEPQVLSDLIRTNVIPYRDDTIYRKVKQREVREKSLLESVSNKWDKIACNWDDIQEKYC